MTTEDSLRSITLTPYLIKATALIGKARHVGGNQFRHAFATLGILLDHKYFTDSVLLKAALVHDLFEDVPLTNRAILLNLDEDGEAVTKLVLEVTREKNEPKDAYLNHILKKGSRNAKTLKVADRISNLTDMNRSIYSKEKMARYLDETEKYVLKMAKEVSKDLHRELDDLIKSRRKMIDANL